MCSPLSSAHSQPTSITRWLLINDLRGVCMFANTRTSSHGQNTGGLIGYHPWDGPGGFSLCQLCDEAKLMARSIKTTATVLWQLSVEAISPGCTVSRVEKASQNNSISLFHGGSFQKPILTCHRPETPSDAYPRPSW